MDDFKIAAKAYLHDDRFSDFTIVCKDKDYKVHRCFISAHSKWFQRCCLGEFTEANARRVELVEDLPSAVKCMIEYFYKFDYSDSIDDNGAAPDPEGQNPDYPIQLNAHVYAIADKYEIPGLKCLALTKFNEAAKSFMRVPDHMLAAAITLYKWLELPESDRVLKDTLLDAWVVGSSDLLDNGMDRDYMGDMFEVVPDFAADLGMKYMAATRQVKQIWVECPKCHAKQQIGNCYNAAHMSYAWKSSCCRLPVKEALQVVGHVEVKKFW